MDFALSREQALFQRTVQRFADGVLRPAAAEVDETNAFPPDLLRRTAEVGLFGLLVPEGFGGSAVDTLRWVLAVEQLAGACAAMASLLVAHSALVCLPLGRAGSAQQQSEWLPPLANGDAMAAGALPPATIGRGHPLLGLTANSPGGWRLSGRAGPLSYGGTACLYVLWAVEASRPGLKGVVCAAPSEGLRVGPAQDRMGLRGAAVAEVVAEELVLSPDAVLASGNGALAAEVRDLYCLGVAAQALGIAQAALDAAVAYASERRQFGRPIGSFEGLRWMIADLHLAVQAARLLVYRAAWLRDAGQPFGTAAALAKLAAAPAATHVATKAVQIHGGYGYMRESPVQRYLRDAKGTELAAGASGAQRNAIADALLPLAN